jgi:FkbM family methyltransferase
MISALKKTLRPYKRLFEKYIAPPKKPQPIYHRTSYSQEGEDMILSRIFADKANGFYVDVGAHHPQRFSNTYYFYLLGWNGINIDAMPESMKIFNEIRPNDLNLEVGISETRQELTYYAFAEPAYSSFCKEVAEEYSQLYHLEIAFEKEIQTYPLSEVLDEHLPLNQSIDFLNIDVEGLDYQVLNSNDWEKYRPTIVLVEDLKQTSFCEANQSKVALFMREQNYTLYCKTMHTLIFSIN